MAYRFLSVSDLKITTVYISAVTKKQWNILFAKNTCGSNTRSDGVKPTPIIHADPPKAKRVPITAMV